MRNLLLLLCLCFALVACDKSTSKAPNKPDPEGGDNVCSLEGTWSRCSDTGDSSSLVTLVISGGVLVEEIKNYNSSDSCGGTADDQFDFKAEIEVGEMGASTVMKNGTEVKLTTDPDIFGCGMGKPAYTVLRVDAGCEKFYAAAGNPSCDFDSRPSTIDPDPFIKIE